MIRRPPRSTPLSLHDALPISITGSCGEPPRSTTSPLPAQPPSPILRDGCWMLAAARCFLPHKFTSHRDRKSTRLNSSHDQISYAVFCLKKKTALTSHGARLHS